MGMRLFGNSGARGDCRCNYCSPTPPPPLPNPNPSRWVLLDHIQIGPFLVVKLRYPDCVNFEGKKIMVFRASLSSLQAQGEIDPHFGEGGRLYPIARFQPTEEGWRDALRYAEMKSIVQSEMERLSRNPD